MIAAPDKARQHRKDREMKTSELTGAALDWAVAKCEGRNDVYYAESVKQMLWEGTYEMDDTEIGYALYQYTPSTNWAQGGPIIERECIGLRGPSIRGNAWAAFIDLSGISQGPQHRHTGPTPLIAAMRCYVASKLGDDVDVPDMLE
jgi:hypothetical protein